MISCAFSFDIHVTVSFYNLMVSITLLVSSCIQETVAITIHFPRIDYQECYVSCINFVVLDRMMTKESNSCFEAYFHLAFHTHVQKCDQLKHVALHFL
jgi:hypothetical protein